MNQNWTITYTYKAITTDTIFTAPSILDAIQQLSETGIPISDIKKVELDEE